MSLYDVVLSEATKYFKGNDLAAKVWVDKYALRNNQNELLELTPDDMHRRLAKEFARIEKGKFKKPLTEEEIYSYLKDFGQIIPQGSPMYGIGNPYQFITLSNCYVLEPPVDSYGGIMKTDQQLVQIAKRRGGNGIDLDNLRPDDTPTQNASRTSTGTISFAKRYSNSTREVGQAGRRGALMLTLSVDHPDIYKFVTCKKDTTEITGANISVKLKDHFLEAVEKDMDFNTRWPLNGKPQIERKLSARLIWNEIIQNAHATAEPGILFWDTILRESPADCYAKYGFRTISTNPCQPASAPVLMQHGLSKFGNIKAGDMIWDGGNWARVVRKWSTGVKKVYKFTTTAGYFLGTEDHRLVSNGTKIKANDAESIDIIAGCYNPHVCFDNEVIMDGLVLGDGSIHKASNNLVYLNIGEDDSDYFTSEIANLIIKRRSGLGACAYEIKTNILPEELPHTYERKIPDRFKFSGKNIICSFLRGLYSANGSVCGNRITLKSASLDIIQDVQIMLSAVGIKSYYTTNKPTRVKFGNGEYECKESYDLNISSDREKFVTIIGFIQKYKNEKIKITNTYLRKESYDIISKELVGEEEVFDIEVDNPTHTYWTGGCNVSNCSELPLSVLDSCRLLVVNLMSCVKEAFKKCAKFCFDTLYKLAQVAQRLMDDMVDLELECIERIINKIKKDPEEEEVKRVELDLWKSVYQNCRNGRRTGTGVTGIGDVIACLGMKYDSNKAVEFTEKVYKTLKLGAYRASVDMAKELGPFPVWDHELEKDNVFLLRIKEEDEKLWNDMRKYGRRNIALLTTAPTGSTSLLSKMLDYYGTTSGIEPCFMMSYIRKKKGNPSDENFKTDSIDENGDHWHHFKVYHAGVQAWMDATGETDETKSPYAGSCAEELDWKQRVKLQAAAQKHIDHAISSTINLPENVSVETVAEIYHTAWKAGCKGMTVYRKNCRSGVLVEEVTQQDHTKRPKSLDCDIYHVSVQGNPYLVFVGLLDEKPYEVMAIKNGFVPKHVKKGTITKIKRGVYRCIMDNEQIIDNIVENAPEEEALTRLSSALLRHGVDVNIIAQQLEKTKGNMTTFAKAIARALKKYIADGTILHGEGCPSCGGPNIARSEGCKVCKDCGWSGCS